MPVSRASLLAAGLLTATFAGMMGSSGCVECDGSGRHPLDIGTDADLDVLVVLDRQWGKRHYDFLAAGADGTVVVWGYKDRPFQSRPFVELSDLGDADLNAVWIEHSLAWWVVGDAGMVAVSHDYGASWNTIELPVGDADLHGITSFRGRLVVIGDEVVLVRDGDGTWIEPPVPVGGWGQLRAIGARDLQLYAVGRRGVAWTTDDPREQWTSEAVGMEVDLLDICDTHSYDTSAIVIVGTHGAAALVDASGWTELNTGVSTDLIDCDTGYVLAADGEVYRASEKPWTSEETIPGARALILDGYDTITTVGIGGLATRPNGC